ncbi:MAG: hypothetical protein RR998_01130 [Oscillospiraceae bacterium]
MIGKMKQFFDKNGICLTLVHHKRKTPSEDKFEMISGTTGLTRLRDGAFVSQKEKRTDSAAVLDAVGRNPPDQKILFGTNNTLTWDFDHAERGLWKEPPDPMLEAVAKLLTQRNSEWAGSATELTGSRGLDVQPNALTKKLHIKSSRLMQDFNVRNENCHTRTGSVIELELIRSRGVTPVTVVTMKQGVGAVFKTPSLSARPPRK